MSNKVKQQGAAPTDDELNQLIAEGVASHAVKTGLVDPEQAEAAEARAVAEVENLPIQIDPQMLQQAVANKNARLIAVMVNETAMLEVALETERREKNELKAQVRALEAALAELAA